MTTALERLQTGYYNSNPVSAANPGGLDDDGHETNFPAALGDVATAAGLAGASAADAAAQVTLAAAYAATALNAPGTLATQTTNLTIAAVNAAVNGQLAQTGKAYQEGMWLVFWNSVANWMIIQLATFVPATGIWTGTVKVSSGAGTFNSWKVALTSSGGVQPDRSITVAGGMLSGGGDLSANRTLTLLPASAADMWGNNDVDAVTGASIRRGAAKQAVAYAATININLALGWNAKTTLTANAIMGLPTNIWEGCSGRIEITQDGTGSRLITAWNAFFEWDGGVPPVLSTVAGKIDVIYYDVYDASGSPKAKCTFRKAT